MGPYHGGMIRELALCAVGAALMLVPGGCALPPDDAPIVRLRPLPPDGPTTWEVDPLANAKAAPVEPIAPVEAVKPRVARGEIVVAGRRFPVDAPVVLWTDPGGYDAYRETKFFGPDGGDPTRRFGVRQDDDGAAAGRVRNTGWTLGALRDSVDQFVIHYDVAGTSRTCFRVLHDQRNLSVHFLLDLDGTIYQTLDLRERAWHATKANDRSIGIEIANIGAYPVGQQSPLDSWYAPDGNGGTRVVLPGYLGDGGVRTAGYVARPARRDPVVGMIQGEKVRMYDLTDAQYASLIALTTTLCEVFPELRAEAPRGPDGRVLDHAMSDEAYRRFRGILGHYHVQENKIDPGPAFDWDRLLGGVRANLARDGYQSGAPEHVNAR